MDDDLPDTRVFVSGLPPNFTDDELGRHFAGRYQITDAQVIPGRRIGFVGFRNYTLAKNAIKYFDKSYIRMSRIHVEFAKAPVQAKNDSGRKRPHSSDEYSISQLPLKKRKAVRRKLEASASSISWNSLYMNPDTIMASVAERLGIKKSDILDPTASDAAVKQAHAETHMIEEAKLYFTERGVKLEALRGNSGGGTALLVKNLAYGTTADEIRSLFEPYGQIARLLFPPSGTLAIVEFINATDAHYAVKELAYRNHRGSVLFLQRAAEDLFSNCNENQSVVKPIREDANSRMEDGPSNMAMHSSSTLFIRNLSFATTSTRLMEYCQPMEGFISAKVKTKPDPNNASQTLSMGYGFAEFKAARQAESALKALDGCHLDGHDLHVQFAQRSLDLAEGKRAKSQSQASQALKTKIVIKNLPFETTKKDVRALFGPYGQLRSVRVPKKFDRSTRGFAFADFVSGKEAANAINALENTHLLGRRLVLEFASEEAVDPEQEIRAIEERIGKQTDAINLKKIKGSGRKKFNVDDE